ncbi:hypothetical protein MTR67_044325 [Solanum verrucosum]|uniref:Uncharacterized protein n=1 Tax=Solanum verrucosum TaxID=315347 RepID=A0AAF0US11_SOLVR|nr:hypothetical protein MTR67_044325 [Solanum verrucosum]
MMPFRYRKAPPLLAFGWYIFIRTDVPLPGDAAFCFVRPGHDLWVQASLFRGYRVLVTLPISGRDKLGIKAGRIPGGPQAVSSRVLFMDREIGMDPREDTSRSAPGQRDRFPSEAHSGSPVPP